MPDDILRDDVIRMVEREPTTFEERVARLEAKEAIHDVMMRYGHFSDARDTEGVLALYTDDVERVLIGTLDERVRGKDTLRELYRNPVLPTKDGRSLGEASRYKRGRKTTVRHMFAAPLIRLSDDGDEGWLTSYFTLVRSVASDEGFERHVHEGTYTFTFVRTDEGWKISKMVVDTEIGHDRGYNPAAATKQGAGS
jgi:ketosteroid isomerase-like protein